jgi:hypothetical protein
LLRGNLGCILLRFGRNPNYMFLRSWNIYAKSFFDFEECGELYFLPLTRIWWKETISAIKWRLKGVGRIRPFSGPQKIRFFYIGTMLGDAQQGCHLMKSEKRKTRLKIRKKAEREIEKAEIYIFTRFHEF